MPLFDHEPQLRPTSASAHPLRPDPARMAPAADVQPIAHSRPADTPAPTGAPLRAPGPVQAAGHPLDATTRAFMEPRFGHDFSHIRVHTGPEAAQSAAALNARAYTVGPAIVFGAGEYAPATAAGRKLLAHELAHTIQQGARPAPAPGEVAAGPADDVYERAAETAAERVVAPDTRGAARLPVLSPTQARIQRQPAKTGDTPAPVVIPGSMPAIFFQFDTAEIRHDAEVDSMIHFVHVLTQVQAHVKKHGAAARIILHGFASMDGEKAHNLALSQKRADRIKELLVEAGIPEAQITAIGHGGDSTFPELALNRRVATELAP